MVLNQTWQEANEWEGHWHGDCVNSYNEESKQYTYAHYMGMDVYSTNYYGQRGWDFGNKSVLDVGCGPYSMLMKISTTGLKVGVDPCDYPEWVGMRYDAAKVAIYKIKAEEINQHHLHYEKSPNVFDEVLLYNCLQHTENPELICKNILSVARTVRVFEWIDAGISPGHLHDLKEDKINYWLGGSGRVLNLNQSPVVGKAYVGVFKGDHYGK